MSREVDPGRDFALLIEHYRRSGRALPWRERTGDPYAVLVSEFMLQQTRVETVLRYYEPFLARFPDFKSLAAATEHDVMTAWAGLGYYRRARNLMACARAVARRGGFPDRLEDIRALPGVGEYTAAALWSIVFGRPALALDGNAERVLWRYFACSGTAGRTAVRRELATSTLSAIPDGAAGDFTQALMELGATLCRPVRPQCPACPLRRGCRARAQDRVQDFPPARPVAPARHLLWARAVACREGRVLLRRSGPGELTEGLWQCPGRELERPEEAPAALVGLLAAWGEPGPLRLLGEVRHAITLRRIRCQVFQCELYPATVCEGPGGCGEEVRWVAPQELGAWPLTAPARRMLALWLRERA